MINPRQCRAARALLGLAQLQLADLAGVGKRAVIEFESAARDPLLSTLQSLQAALERQGVEFLHGNGGGSGVRFRDAEVEQNKISPKATARRQSLGNAS